MPPIGDQIPTSLDRETTLKSKGQTQEVRTAIKHPSGEKSVFLKLSEPD